MFIIFHRKNVEMREASKDHFNHLLFSGSIMVPFKAFFLKICICNNFLVCMYMKKGKITWINLFPQTNVACASGIQQAYLV